MRRDHTNIKETYGELVKFIVTQSNLLTLPPPRSFALPIRLGDPPWDLREEGERMQTVRSPSKTKELALTRELRVSDLPH